MSGNDSNNFARKDDANESSKANGSSHGSDGDECLTHSDLDSQPCRESPQVISSSDSQDTVIDRSANIPRNPFTPEFVSTASLLANPNARCCLSPELSSIIYTCSRRSLPFLSELKVPRKKKLVPQRYSFSVPSLLMIQDEISAVNREIQSNLRRNVSEGNNFGSLHFNKNNLNENVPNVTTKLNDETPELSNLDCTGKSVEMDTVEVIETNVAASIYETPDISMLNDYMETPLVPHPHVMNETARSATVKMKQFLLDEFKMETDELTNQTDVSSASIVTNEKIPLAAFDDDKTNQFSPNEVFESTEGLLNSNFVGEFNKIENIVNEELVKPNQKDILLFLNEIASISNEKPGVKQKTKRIIKDVTNTHEIQIESTTPSLKESVNTNLPSIVSQNRMPLDSRHLFVTGLLTTESEYKKLNKTQNDDDLSTAPKKINFWGQSVLSESFDNELMAESEYVGVGERDSKGSFRDKRSTYSTDLKDKHSIASLSAYDNRRNSESEDTLSHLSDRSGQSHGQLSLKFFSEQPIYKSKDNKNLLNEYSELPMSPKEIVSLMRKAHTMKEDVFCSEEVSSNLPCATKEDTNSVKAQMQKTLSSQKAVMSQALKDFSGLANKILSLSKTEVYETGSRDKSAHSEDVTPGDVNLKNKILNDKSSFLLENVNNPVFAEELISDLSLLKMKYVKLIGLSNSEASDTGSSFKLIDEAIRSDNYITVSTNTYESNLKDESLDEEDSGALVKYIELKTDSKKTNDFIFNETDDGTDIDSVQPNPKAKPKIMKNKKLQANTENKDNFYYDFDKPLLTENGLPAFLYNKAGFPLTDSKGRGLKNNLGINMLPVGNLKGVYCRKLQVYDSLSYTPTMLKFDPERKPKPSKSTDIRVSDRAGLPITLYNNLGFPLTDVDGWLLRNNEGKFLVELDNLGVPICCGNGEPIYMPDGKLWIVVKDLYDILHRGSELHSLRDTKSKILEKDLVHDLIKKCVIHKETDIIWEEKSRTDLPKPPITFKKTVDIQKNLQNLVTLQKKLTTITKSLKNLNIVKGRPIKKMSEDNDISVICNNLSNITNKINKFMVSMRHFDHMTHDVEIARENKIKSESKGMKKTNERSNQEPVDLLFLLNNNNLKGGAKETEIIETHSACSKEGNTFGKNVQENFNLVSKALDKIAMNDPNVFISKSHKSGNPLPSSDLLETDSDFLYKNYSMNAIDALKFRDKRFCKRPEIKSYKCQPVLISDTLPVNLTSQDLSSKSSSISLDRIVTNLRKGIPIHYSSRSDFKAKHAKQSPYWRENEPKTLRSCDADCPRLGSFRSGKGVNGILYNILNGQSRDKSKNANPKAADRKKMYKYV